MFFFRCTFSIDPGFRRGNWFWISCQQRNNCIKAPNAPPSTPNTIPPHPTDPFLPLTTVRNCPLTPRDPPIGPFHCATMAAGGRVIWGTKEPSNPPAPRTMPTPAESFLPLTSLMTGFILSDPDPQEGLQLPAQPAVFLPADPPRQQTRLWLTSAHFQSGPAEINWSTGRFQGVFLPPDTWEESEHESNIKINFLHKNMLETRWRPDNNTHNT